MVSREFFDDLKNRKTKLKAHGYKGVVDEMSSEEGFTKDVTNFTLCLLYDKPMLYDSTTRVTATCAGDDDYDPAKGREICNVKADLKYHQKMYDRYLKVAWLLRKVSNRLMEYVDFHQKKIERLEKDLKQYM